MGSRISNSKDSAMGAAAAAAMLGVSIPRQPPLALDAADAIAYKIFPDGKLHSIGLPKGPDGVYVVGKQADSEPNRAATYRNVTIDQNSGKILHVQDRASFSVGETFLEWQYPLHCGEAFGNYGRAFIMLMGFVPLILFVTGFTRWRQKRRAQKERQRDASLASAKSGIDYGGTFCCAASAALSQSCESRIFWRFSCRSSVW